MLAAPRVTGRYNLRFTLQLSRSRQREVKAGRPYITDAVTENGAKQISLQFQCNFPNLFAFSMVAFIHGNMNCTTSL